MIKKIDLLWEIIFCINQVTLNFIFGLTYKRKEEEKEERKQEKENEEKVNDSFRIYYYNEVIIARKENRIGIIFILDEI